MKKSASTLAALATCVGCSVPAFAQSSVSMYGLISTGIGYASNAGGSRQYGLYSGTMQNNRWGFLIREDLGGGYTVIAQLENGFDITNGKLGQGGRLFGRQAWVGLSSDKYGTLTLGRQYDAFWDYLSVYAAPNTSGGTLAAHPGDADNLMGSWRYNNSIKYATPTWAGFSAEGLYAMSNATNFAMNRAWTAGVRYTGQRFSAAVAYVDIQSPGTLNASGAVTDDYAGAPFFLFRTSPLNNTAGVRRQRNVGGGANYKVTDKFTVSAFADDIRYDYVDHTSLRLDNFDVSLSYKLTPSLFLSGAYVYTSGAYGGLQANPHWNTGVASIDYFLSKRTDLYLYDIFQRTSGPRATAAIYGAVPSTGRTQNLLIVGIRHKF
ncbi:porin [Burkholderia sp. JKS000303]|uniref:porin n=1 Tax=Burkholderia sp. JKS000303 TaxID=1938747 RepID=UPI000BF27189|nr:porin [Burkholderia sp. JKS000303]PFH19012.1 putative porin [Burkholderia sp. JKS000303]